MGAVEEEKEVASYNACTCTMYLLFTPQYCTKIYLMYIRHPPHAEAGPVSPVVVGGGVGNFAHVPVGFHPSRHRHVQACSVTIPHVE